MDSTKGISSSFVEQIISFDKIILSNKLVNVKNKFLFVDWNGSGISLTKADGSEL
jgi:hypothetical protein